MALIHQVQSQSTHAMKSENPKDMDRYYDLSFLNEKAQLPIFLVTCVRGPAPRNQANDFPREEW